VRACAADAGPLIFPRDAEHLNETATAEAQPLHHHQRVLGAVVLRLRDDFVTLLAADADLFGRDDPEFRSVYEGPQRATGEVVALGRLWRLDGAWRDEEVRLLDRERRVVRPESEHRRAVRTGAQDAETAKIAEPIRQHSDHVVGRELGADEGAPKRGTQHRVRISVLRGLGQHRDDNCGHVVGSREQRPFAHRDAVFRHACADQLRRAAGCLDRLACDQLHAARAHLFVGKILLDLGVALHRQFGDDEHGAARAILEALEPVARGHPRRRHDADARAGREYRLRERDRRQQCKAKREKQADEGHGAL